MLVSVLLLALGSGTAAAADEPPDNVCVRRTLKGAEVTASVRLAHEGQDSTQVSSELDIKVPRTWMWAPYLLLNEDTEEYRTAMRCLLRPSDVPMQYRDTEWQYRKPQVSADKAWITVRQRTLTWVSVTGDRDVGPWHIEAGERYWALALVPPDALAGARWSEIRVDLGGEPARSVTPTPTVGTATTLTWTTQEKTAGPPPQVRLLLQPPATKANSARWSSYPWDMANTLTWITWDLAVAALSLALVRTLAHRPPLALPTAAEEATRRNLRRLVLAWLLITLVHAVDDHVFSALARQVGDGVGDGDGGRWFTDHWEALVLGVSTALGLMLCRIGRPGRAATAAVALAAGYIAVVVGRPALFGLPRHMFLYWVDDPAGVAAFEDAGGAYWFALACAALIFVWLVGLVSTCLRLWRDSNPSTTGGPPPSGRFPHAVLAALASASCALPAAGMLAAESWWDRVSWLADQSEGTAYPVFHTAVVFNDQRWFPSNFLDWIPGYVWWWTTGLALAAVARAWRTAPGHTGETLLPRELDFLKVFFVVAVAPVVGWYGGVPLTLISLAVLWFALTALLAIGRRGAVLSRELVHGVPLHQVVGERHRTRLMNMARQHRERHAELRRLEQGQAEVERAAVERKLDRLHRWTPPNPRHPHERVPLPHSVGPVELALAWGPRADWWDNACRAAVVAAVVGLPANGVLFWMNHVRGTAWTDKFSQRFGFVEVAMNVASAELIYAGAGFTLGALWRVLPGRRGPGRGCGVGLVYALPLLVDQLGNTLAGQPGNNEVLDAAFTTLVLTVTGMVLDIDTFRRERRYWPTRAGLLLSLYQMRSASAQIALFVAQLVALVTIWQQLSSDPPVVLIDHQGPSGISVPGADGASGH
ncbi:DUF6185 family protein [Streptomyces sp. NPDC051921]|uniref:DUF6185 family protein n=1 Tax=Streptomyces sp. NPDC051921 TaxID=3155806 RepID=UPI0034223B0D